MKASDALVAALCPTCHTQLDQGGDITRTEKRDLWNRAYIMGIKELIETGKLVLKG